MKKDIYLVVPPGFEDLAIQELEFRGIEIDSGVKTKGGFELKCDERYLKRMHKELKIPTRILERLISFRVRDFPKLFKLTKELSWGAWVSSPEVGLSFSVSCRRSRLMNKKRIEKTIKEAILKSNPKIKFLESKEEGLTLYVRFEDDICHLSLSMMTSNLFKRGYKLQSGVAPIRENLAAGLLFKLFKLAGEPNRIKIFDPMCGSGTFLTEALLFFNGTDVELLKLKGFDKETTSIQVATENLSRLQKKLRTKVPVSIESCDFLDNSEDEVFGGVIICNPPYGERLRLPESPKTYYPKLLKRIHDYAPSLTGLIIPEKFHSYLPEPIDEIKFKNGGFDVRFKIYKSI